MPGSELQQRIEADMKAAMRARDKQRLGTIRLAMAEFKRIEVDERIELDDARVVAILNKMMKQRRDSVTQFLKAERQDLVDQEQFEIGVLQEYLPEQLDDEAIVKLLEASIAEAGATSMKEMGKVMALLKPKIEGRADMGAVSKMLKEQLTGA